MHSIHLQINFEKEGYGYFNSDPIVETYEGSYADKKANISESYVLWKYGIVEVFISLIKNNLQINSFDEFDYSP